MRGPWRLWIAALLGVVVLAAASGCGGSDEETSTLTPAATVTPTVPDTPEAPAANSSDDDADGQSSSSASSDDDAAAGYGAGSDDMTDSQDNGGETMDGDSDDDPVSFANDGSDGGSDDGSDGGSGDGVVVNEDGSSSFGRVDAEASQRSPANINSAQKVVRESWPAQFAVIISGELLNGCQELAWEQKPLPDSTYEVNVWQVLRAEEIACTQALVPFEVQIELGESEAEDFTVVVNGTSY